MQSFDRLFLSTWVKREWVSFVCLLFLILKIPIRDLFRFVCVSACVCVCVCVCMFSC